MATIVLFGSISYHRVPDNGRTLSEMLRHIFQFTASQSDADLPDAGLDRCVSNNDYYLIKTASIHELYAKVILHP